VRFEPKKVERKKFEGRVWVHATDFDQVHAFNKEQTKLLRDLYADRVKDGYRDELQERLADILKWAEG